MAYLRRFFAVYRMPSAPQLTIASPISSASGKLSAVRGMTDAGVAVAAGAVAVGAGEAVGVAVGASVGAGVACGAAAGAVVGAGVGAVLGFAVGSAVGAALGVGVGVPVAAALHGRTRRCAPTSNGTVGIFALYSK